MICANSLVPVTTGRMAMDIQLYKKILYRSFVGSDLSNLDSDLNKYDIGTITAFRSEFSYDLNP